MSCKDVTPERGGLALKDEAIDVLSSGNDSETVATKDIAINVASGNDSMTTDDVEQIRKNVRRHATLDSVDSCEASIWFDVFTLLDHARSERSFTSGQAEKFAQRVVKRLRRFAARNALSLGAIVCPLVATAMIFAIGSTEALHLCNNNLKNHVKVWSVLVSMATVGAFLGMTLGSGVTSTYLHWVLLYLLGVLSFLIVELLEDLLEGCSDFELGELSYETVAWVGVRLTFQFMVKRSLRGFLAALGEEAPKTAVTRARNASAALFIAMLVPWVLHFTLAQKHWTLLLGLLLAAFVLCDLIFCALVIVAIRGHHRLATKAFRELDTAGLATDVPESAFACVLTRRYIISMISSMVLVMSWSLISVILMGKSNVLAEFASLVQTPLTLCSVVVTTIAAVILSGVINRHEALSRERAAAEERRQRRRARMMRSFRDRDIDEDPSWWAKVTELSHCGITLEALLHFYRGLGTQYMTDFRPDQHTTKDVVRAAIIPLSKEAQCAYANVMMQGQPVMPKTMVTHDWGNLFHDLVAAIVTDALDQREFGMIADLLTWDIDMLEVMLRRSGKLKGTYWICAFSINQHDSICGANPFHDCDPLTGREYSPCFCGKEKHFNKDGFLTADGRSIECELNKFDDVMALLAASNPESSQLICVGARFKLFTRAWCIAEIAQAFVMGMEQRLLVISRRQLRLHEHSLRSLKVCEMEASRKEDRDEILAKIQDTSKFDDRMQELIFGTSGLLACWQTLDGGQMMSRIGWWIRWCRARSGRRSCWLEDACEDSDVTL